MLKKGPHNKKRQHAQQILFMDHLQIIGKLIIFGKGHHHTNFFKGRTDIDAYIDTIIIN